MVVLCAINVARGLSGTPGDLLKRLAVMVVNRGTFTITRIEALFSYDGMSLIWCWRSGWPSSRRPNATLRRTEARVAAEMLVAGCAHVVW